MPHMSTRWQKQPFSTRAKTAGPQKAAEWHGKSQNTSARPKAEYAQTASKDTLEVLSFLYSGCEGAPQSLALKRQKRRYAGHERRVLQIGASSSRFSGLLAHPPSQNARFSLTNKSHIRPDDAAAIVERVEGNEAAEQDDTAGVERDRNSAGQEPECFPIGECPVRVAQVQIKPRVGAAREGGGGG